MWLHRLFLFLCLLTQCLAFGPMTAKELTSLATTLRNQVNQCEFRDLSGAISNVAKIGQKYPVLIHTPCFEDESFGNFFSNYIEARLCADAAGLNYVAINLVHPNSFLLIDHPFFQTLPRIAINNNAGKLGRVHSQGKLRELCKCSSSCHASSRALMHHNIPFVASVFQHAMDSYWNRQQSSVRSLSLSVLPNHSGSVLWNGSAIIRLDNIESGTGILNKTNLPIIPDVVIHYRCGDNVNALYGFVPFALYKDIIPKDTKYIYVLSENPNRKTLDHHRERCQRVLEGLLKYLKVYFSTAIILILRGHDVFEDLARLTYAPMTICSPSTYCFFPAISSKTKAYFPETGLVAGSLTKDNYGPYFHWLTDLRYPVCSGADAIEMTVTDLVRYLSRETPISSN